MRFLFWNTNKNESVNRILVDLINENSIDYTVLAEYTANSEELCGLLRDKANTNYQRIDGLRSI